MEQTSANIVTCLAVWRGDIIVEIVVREELEQDYGVIP
jgi:hypothetical protein